MLQEVFDVRLVAPEQLSFEGCAKMFNEKNKVKKTSRVVLGVRFRERKDGFIELDSVIFQDDGLTKKPSYQVFIKSVFAESDVEVLL